MDLQTQTMFGFQLTHPPTGRTPKSEHSLQETKCTPQNNFMIFGWTDYFLAKNPNIRLPQTHPLISEHCSDL